MDSIENTKRLMKFLNDDFEMWKERQRAEARNNGGLWYQEPDEKHYCQQRLGQVPYESFHRWKQAALANKAAPISELNLLRLAIALGDETPLRIYGFETIPSDLWAILVRLPTTEEPQRQKIMRILTEKQEPERVYIPAD